MGCGVVWRDLVAATLAKGMIPRVLTNNLGVQVSGTLSMAGLGVASFRYGAQADNVLELEVVTGVGEIVTCSREQHRDLFDVVRCGIAVYEIQQPSTTTYRLFDWNRGREMHVAAGLAALDAASRPHPVTLPPDGDRTAPIPAVRCEHFALDVLMPGPGEAVVLGPESGPQAFTCAWGEAELSVAGGEALLPAGATAVLFANAGPARVSSLGGARVMRGWLGR